MPTRTMRPVLGKLLRLTRLDECGNPYPAGTPGAQIVTPGFISVKLKSEVENGEEITQRRADGALCVNEKFADSFKYFTLTVEFCDVNPAVLALVSNAEIYNDYANNPSGFTIPEGTMSNAFALELWTGLSGQACESGGDTASGYMLLPFVNGGPLGDLEIGSKDAITFSVDGAYTKGGNAWGRGPYNVVYDSKGVPSNLPTAIDPLDHLLLMDTGLKLPTASDDLLPMPAAPTNGTAVPVTTTTTTTPPAWKATTAYTVGQTVTNAGGTLQVVTAGTSGSSAPTNPAVNSNVTDGSVTWKRTA